MIKPSRRLWEQNARNREFWGEPPQPMPGDGFAEEPLSPLFEDVRSVFRTALGSHAAALIASPSIDRIARLLKQWRELPSPSDPKLRLAIDLERVHELQHAAAALEKILGGVLKLMLPRGVPGDPAAGRLIDLLNALRLAAPYIGPPSVQGRQRRALAWHVMARGLREPVKAALASAWHPKAASALSHALVHIIADLLGLIAVDPPTNAAVESVLKRQRQVPDHGPPDRGVIT
jgi:hypothetical protein